MPDAKLPLFYKEPRPLVANVHDKLSLRAGGNFAFAAKATTVTLMVAEFAVACRDLPILFADGPKPFPVALLGIRGEENLFVDAAGAWAPGVYVPAYVRRYPFIFFEDAHKATLTLCIDEAADVVVRDASNPMFVDGKPSPALEAALAFASEFQAQTAQTAAFVDAVVAADLLVERRADVTLEASGERFSLSGFKVIDEARLNGLSRETLVEWRDRGWLWLAYAHLISLANWARLVDRKAGKA